MQDNNPLFHAVTQLSRMPGVGPKSAQRLAFFFLSLPKKEVHAFAQTLVETRNNIRYCITCYNISFSEQCYVCINPNRQSDALCVVAEPKDLMAIEKTGEFKGYYHILGGLISPIDGIQPDALRIKELLIRLEDKQFSEIIIALNPSIEGETTAMYLMNMLKKYELSVTSLAYGLPMGGDIDYADEITLQKAIRGRRNVE